MKQEISGKILYKTIVIIMVISLTSILLIKELEYSDPYLYPGHYSMDLVKMNGDYVIDIKEHDNDPLIIRKCKYEFTDEQGNTMESGNLMDIWEKDPEFLNENFSTEDNTIYILDDNRDMKFGDDDYVIIRSHINGGIGRAGCMIRISIWITEKRLFKDYEYYKEFLSVKLRDNIPVSNISFLSPHFVNSPTFKFVDLNKTNKGSLNISTEHLSSDSNLQFFHHQFPIGITLINNGTEPLDGISLNIFCPSDSEDNDHEFQKNLSDISIENNSMKRIIMYFSIEWDPHHEVVGKKIFIEIQSEKFDEPLTLWTELEFIMELGH